MTREEIIKWLESLKVEIGKPEHRILWHYAEAIDLAIEALKLNNLINREDALERINKATNLTALAKHNAIYHILKTPTAEPKRGKWIPKLSSEDKVRRYECSICGYVHIKHPYTVEFFCPNCGAKME